MTLLTSFSLTEAHFDPFTRCVESSLLQVSDFLTHSSINVESDSGYTFGDAREITATMIKMKRDTIK